MLRPLLVLLLLLLPGCSHFVSPPPVGHTNNRLIWSEGIAYGESFWRREFNRHLGRKPDDPNLVIFVCHGGPNKNGDWCAFPDDSVNGHKPVLMRDVAKGLVTTHPGQLVALVSCNEKGSKLGVPGVLYARRVVMAIPHTAWPWLHEDADQFDDFGTDEHPGPLAGQ